MPPRLGVRGVVAIAAIGAVLTGCASTRATPALLCNLDSLRWSHAFVPRADARECVPILESVEIRN